MFWLLPHMPQTHCSNPDCKVLHKAAKKEELEKEFRNRGSWTEASRPVEVMDKAAMEAHIRSGTKHTAHTLAITYREGMKRDKVTIEGGYRSVCAALTPQRSSFDGSLSRWRLCGCTKHVTSWGSKSNVCHCVCH